MVCLSGTASRQRCFTGYAPASGVVLRCLAITGQVMAAVWCLVSLVGYAIRPWHRVPMLLWEVHPLGLVRSVCAATGSVLG